MPWGPNVDGSTLAPTEALTGVKATAVGGNFSVALKLDGSVLAWGRMDFGQTAVPAAALSGVRAISAGRTHSLAVKVDDTVVTWGQNVSDVLIIPPQAQSGVRAVGAGTYFSVALKNDGSVLAWGEGASGATAVPLAAQSGVQAISVGGLHVLALKDNGSVVAWGQNVNGQLNVPLAALSGVVAVSAGGGHSLALKSDGSVIAWGSNSQGQIDVPQGALSDVHAIAAGDSHSVALKNDGTTLAWGNGTFGNTTIPTGTTSGIFIDAESHNLAVLADPILFGNQRPGTTGNMQVFNIRNTGTTPLNLGSIAVKGLHGTDFVVNTVNMLTSLPAGGSTTFSITFQPTALGNRQAILQVPSNDPGQSVIYQPLNGMGTGIEVTSISPENGSANGGTPVTISGVGFTGATAVTFGGIAATNVTVVNDTTITATTPAHALGTSSVQIVTPYGTTGANTLYTFQGAQIQVLGNGSYIYDGDIAPSLTDHTDFGPAAVTGGQVVRTFTIANIGYQPLNLTGSLLVAVSGDHAAEFTVSSAPASSVAVSSSTTFEVTFDPAAAGLRTALLTITSNDLDRTPYTFSLQGGTSLPIQPGVVQLDASTLLQANGSAVTTWGGQTAANVPIFQSFRTPNEGPAVDFNSTDRMGNDVPVPASSAQDWIYVAVIKPSARSGYSNLVDESAFATPMLWIDGSFRYEFNGNAGTEVAAGTGPGGWDIVIADSRLNRLYVNSGTAFVNGGAAVPYATAKSFDFFHRNAVETYQGLVAEIRVYNDRAAFGGDVSQLYNQLYAKWIAPGSTTPSIVEDTTVIPMQPAPFNLIIQGTGFEIYTPANNAITFNNGAVGTVIAAIHNRLTVTMTTAPHSPGALTAVVTNSYGNSGDPIQVAEVVMMPEIAVAESSVNVADGGSYNFGQTPVGTPAIKTFTITNSGTVDLTLSNLTVSSGFSIAQNFDTTTVAPNGGSTTFRIALDATSISTPTGTLSFDSNDSDESPYNFTLAGTVNPPGAEITPVTINAVSSELAVSFNRGAIRAVDNSGLSGGLHTHVADANMWLTHGNFQSPHDLLPAQITFDLGAVYDVNWLHVWNYNEAGAANRGAKDVTVSVASTPGGTFTPVGNLVFPIATGLTDYPGARVDFTATNVRQVRFEITTNHGNAQSFAGLSEIKFFGVPSIAPSVTNVTPSTGSPSGGTSVTISGTNFTGATGVTIGGTAATSMNVVNDTTITAVTPAGTVGSASVLVSSPSGTNAANSAFTYLGPPTVTLSAGNLLSTATSLTITGTGFSTRPGENTVAFSPTGSGTVTGATATSLTVSGVSGLTLGALSAVVTTNGQSSGAPVQVAMVVVPPPGSLDPAFSTSVGGGSGYVYATAVQEDGKIILGGRFTSVGGASYTGLARVNSDGSVDTSFSWSTLGEVRCVAMQADGKILVGGTLAQVGGINGVNHIRRLNPDGSRDTSFNVHVSEATNLSDGLVLCIAVQTDGKILIGGSFAAINSSANAGGRLNFVRLNADGSRDTTFTATGANERVNSIAVQPDGKILLGGLFNNVNGTPGVNYFTRLNADGSLDTAFNASGGIGLGGANERVNSIALQADGKILLGGQFTSVNGSTAVNYFTRLNADGSLDTAFNTSGGIGLGGANSWVNSIVLQADGKILLGGQFTSVNGINGVNRIARLNADGSLDTDFNTIGGISLGGANGPVMGVSLQVDGKILLGGEFNGFNGSSRRFPRLNNEAATQTLTAPDTTQVLWTRGGAGPELTQVTFEQSSDGGASYTALGAGTRIGTTANWQLTGLSLPASGQLRARGRSVGGSFNGSSSLIEQVASFGGMTSPEIAVSGNNVDISEGDLTPAIADDTNFGTRAVSSGTVTRTFTLHNSGTGVLTISSITLGGTNASEFTLSGITLPTIVPANDGTTTFQVTFEPSAAGVRTATVSIASDDSDENPFDFAIQGTGLAAEIDIGYLGQSIASGDTTPTVGKGTDFGAVALSSTSGVRAFDVYALLGLNAGPLEVGPITITGAHAADFVVTSANSGFLTGGGSLAPGENDSFAIRFTPSDVGLRTATVVVQNNDPDKSPYTFAIQGTGMLGAPTVTNVTPATGSTAGGTNVMITGTNFTGATGVTFNGAAATSLDVVNDTTITAVTPVGTAGSASVLVTTPSGTNAANSAFTYVAPVAIISLNRVTAELTRAASVSWTLTFASPVIGLDSSHFSLSGPGATGATIGTPTSADAGLNWTIPVTTGADGVLTLSVTNATGLAPISTTLPYAGQSYNVDKTGPSVTISAPTLATVTAYSSSVSTWTVDLSDPNYLSTGPESRLTLVTTGTASATLFNLTISSGATSGQIIYALGNFRGAGTIRLSLALGTGTDLLVNQSAAIQSDPITVLAQPQPTLTAIIPAGGSTAGGTLVTLTGTNFQDATSVTFGGVAATSVTVTNATTLTCVTPPGVAGATSVVVTNTSSSNEANTLYTYIEPGLHRNYTPNSLPNLSNNARHLFVDVDNDRDQDLLYQTSTTSGVGISLAFNDGTGNFSSVTAATSNGDGTASLLGTPLANLAIGQVNGTNYMVLVDFDADGDDDIYEGFPSATGRFYVNPGTLNGSWTVQAAPFPALSFVRRILFLDATGDGAVDCLLQEGTTNGVGFSLRINDGTGGFATTHTATNNSPSSGLATFTTGPFSGLAFSRMPTSADSPFYLVIDIDRDGDADVLDFSTTQRLLRNNGAGSWTQLAFPLASIPVRLIMHDMDGDGDVDALGQTGSTNFQGIFYQANNGDGTFAAAIQANPAGGFFTSGPFQSLGFALISPGGTGTVDIDGDGDRDFISFGTQTQARKLILDAPYLVSSSPADNDTNIGASSNIELTFNTAVTRHSFGSIHLRQSSDQSLVETFPVTSPRVTGSGTTWTIDPTSELIGNTGYYLIIDPGNFTAGGVSFAGFSSEGRLNFSTTLQAPAVTDVTPATGSTAGGTNVTITGTNFTGATGLTFGGTAAVSFTVVNATTIGAVTPAHVAGAVSVLVTTPSGTNAANTLFTYQVPNAAPVITSNGGEATASIHVAENTTAVTTVTATDSDLPAQNLTFSKSGADADLFTLDSSTGNLRFTAAPDFEGSHVSAYMLTVTVTDDGTSNLSDSQDLTINVTNVNELPSFTKGANQSLPALTSTAQSIPGWATDIDDGDSTVSQALTFNLTNDNNSLFTTQPAIAADGTLTFTPNGSAGSALVSVTLTDDASIHGNPALTTGVQTFTITVAAGPEIAVFKGATRAPLNEIQDNASLHDFGALNVGSPSAAQTYTIQNVGGADLTGIAVSIANPAFTVNTTGMRLTLAPGASTSFSVSFTAADQDSTSGTLNIASNDSNENPFEITLSGRGAMDGAPIITDGPYGGTYPVYEPILLEVTVTGTAPFNYQWSKDGEEIDGARGRTHSFTLTRETAGSYTVVVSNSEGSATSGPAVLEVETRQLLRTDDELPASGFAGAQLYRPLSGVLGPQGLFVINALAAVGPGGITAGSDQVILSNASGDLEAIGHEGQTVGSGTMSRLFYYLNAVENGTTHFRGAINSGSGLNDTAYFISPDGQSLEILSQEGDEAPEGSLTFTGHLSPPAISQSGIVYFDSKLMGSGVTPKNDTGVWFDHEGDQGTLVREGDRAPTGSSVADQAWYGQILAGSVVAGAEAVSFIAELQGDPLNATHKTDGLRNAAIFTGTAGELSLVARKADVIAGLQVRGFNAVSASRDRGHAFVSPLTQGGAVNSSNALALFYKPAVGAPVLVAQKGQLLPDTGVINVFERLFAASGGQVIFEVTLNNTSSSDNALCRWTAAEGIEVLMQEGDVAAGGGIYGALRSITVSGNGKLMIQDSRAVWRDVGEGLELVLKTGDIVPYGEVFRTALSLAINDETVNTRRAGGGFGGMINDDGVVLVIVSVGNGEYTTQILP